MAKKAKLQLLTDEVVRAERIAIDRPLTAEEIGWLDDLSARLRTAYFGGKQDMSLLKRVSAVRTGKHTTAEPAREDTGAQCVQEPPPLATLAKAQTKITKKHTKTSKGFGRINNELSRIAAIKRRLTDEELQRLDELVKETKALMTEDNSKTFRLLHQRARLVRKSLRKSKTPQPKRLERRTAVPRGVLPAGLVGSRRLIQGGREVLGGLPSSRRGH
ncbi:MULTISPECIES: hypothetical protein [Mycobacterium avium complex (MAC)]|uniref:Uncharacterized protein n=1 Tax=Mycobacterium indicus pranii (strain DSM 45239 / MTCC 9506) TaxID=1232724 RepID=J9WEA3_MYCIP|nr:MULTISPECIES: hypothetical protein [Mycobacterium avium complex (MAC)]AFS13636.1 Hypothetical protein MIP_02389 [Mycobacterium intracellulare subsp. intracellulare MTCC 9506]BCO51208.1 hypothetical protein MINTM003_16490 [Mycobacterium paraintracellulare]BCO88394.1 hypothetical protein MINTM015_16510 [Mycobacterium paraintracellulare]